MREMTVVVNAQKPGITWNPKEFFKDQPEIASVLGVSLIDSGDGYFVTKTGRDEIRAVFGWKNEKGDWKLKLTMSSLAPHTRMTFSLYDIREKAFRKEQDVGWIKKVNSAGVVSVKIPVQQGGFLLLT